jgi:hypothetical protein
MQSASPGAQEDSCDAIRRMMATMADRADEWCGLPTPIEGQRLIVEPTHPASAVYASMGKEQKDNRKVVNRWYSRKYKSDICLLRDPAGKLTWGIVPGANHAVQAISTMGCSVAWSLEAESKALEMLAGLIPAHLFKMYVMTGMFLTTSARSKVTYVFRRLRPTIAMRPHPDGDGMKILCCLCLHPIGYYEDTWAGSLCPTDDVISHLLLMKADEPFFWKRANQIPAHRPEAGL